MSWFSRIANVFRSGRLDRDLEEEIRFHIDHRRAEFECKGMTAEEARREIERRFGNNLLLRERSRDAKLFPRLESLWLDVRFGLRMLAKNPVVTVTAVLSLALAIGACTAAFSLIDALILRPLPVREPDRLIYLTYPSDLPGRAIDDYFSYPVFERLRDASRQQVELFTMSGARLRDVQLGGAQQEESALQIRTQYVSGNAFAALGIKPAVGRLIAPDDDRNRSESAVAVISYELWTRFGRDPAILGRRLAWSTDGENAQLRIVGVAEPGFIGVEPGLRVDAWVPNRMASPEAFKNVGWAWFRIMGRLRPGQSSDPARVQVRQVLQRTITDFERELGRRQPRLMAESAANGTSRMRRDFERPLWIVAIVAGLVLLIAGSNVANLLVARAVARRREMALRISIGAGRGRLVQQLLIESGLLAAAACGLGLCLAYAMGPAVVARLLPPGEPAYLDLQVSWRVLGFVALIGAVATALFGLVPALRSSAVSPNEALKSDGGRQSAGSSLLRPLLMAQVAFSFAVLFTGGLLVLSFHNLAGIDTGFSKTGIVLFNLENLGDRAQTPAQQLLDSVRHFPGVAAASYSGWALLDGNRWTSSVGLPGRPQDRTAHMLGVSPGFFATVGIPLLAGREFEARDLDRAASVAIVNERFVHELFPGENPLGQRFVRDSKTVEIVGLVRDAKYLDLRGAAPPTVYQPLRGKGGATLEVHTAADPSGMVPALRALVQRSGPDVRISRVILQSTLLDNLILRERLLALLSGFFAIVAVLLAAIGLYGVLSYSVVRRTKEIGIRMALGARQLAVIKLVIAEIAMVVSLGVAAGLVGGFGLARLVTSLLFEVKPGNAAAVALPLSCLVLAAMFAALPPALRAVRLDPVSALREE